MFSAAARAPTSSPEKLQYSIVATDPAELMASSH